MRRGLLITGLGPGGVDQAPVNLLPKLQEAGVVYLRTKHHPIVSWLVSEGVGFQTFDDYYEQADNFDVVYQNIADTITKAAAEDYVVYAVPGHPLVAEETTRLIMAQAEKSGVPVAINPAMSFLDALFATLNLDPATGLAVFDALALGRLRALPNTGLILTQVYCRLVAGDVKVKLMDHYPDEQAVWVVRAAGVPSLERVEKHPLYMLDRLDWLDHLTTLYVPPVQDVRQIESFDALVDIMQTLRGPQGCPWDQEQTHASLSRYLLEEAYEVVEAIEQNDMDNLCEELGDLLLQIVFNAQIAKETGKFDINQVVAGICEKMIRRHPHVFAQGQAGSAEEVADNWEVIKQKEKSQKPEDTNLLAVPKNLPALLQADRVQDKASRFGFDWPDYYGALQKLEEELQELEQAIQEADEEHISEELGDVLFSVVNLARFFDVDAESALRKTINKFSRRFRTVAENCQLSGSAPTKTPLEQMNKWWEVAKKLNK